MVALGALFSWEHRLQKERDRFGQALDSVRKQLRLGRYILGEQLMITALARNLRLSATPIREALSRLAGEGLVEDRRGMGFFAWRLDAVDLVELYHLQAGYLTMALADFDERRFMSSVGVKESLRAFDAPPRDHEAMLTRVEAAFENIIANGRNAALTRAHRLLADRLAPARHIEASVIGGGDDELAMLEKALAVSDRAAILQIVEKYHARRMRYSPEIVAAMRAAPNECI